jgi:phospholipid/cholesterol/gamma-HCH transport system permease protein
MGQNRTAVTAGAVSALRASVSDSAQLASSRVSVERTPTKAGRARVRLLGSLSFDDAGYVWKALKDLKRQLPDARSLEIDLSGLHAIDGGSAALLLHVQDKLTSRGLPASFVEAAPNVSGVLDMYSDPQRGERRRRRRARGMFDQVGEGAQHLLRETQQVLAFIGQLLVSSVKVLRSPRSANWSELPAIMERAGADATPIVLLINFLVGLVMAFQASQQLKTLGANILVANLIGISVTRELGPLMTAIVVSGRSGAAFAAEFGAMRVNEEIDALQTMGLSVTRFMVLPRIIGLMLVMPLLTLLADACGVLGGLLVGVTVLDLTPYAYVHQLQSAVSLWDVYSGLIKSCMFAFAIALISSQQGLAAEGGAEGVGRRTTSAVVATLFVLILIDAAFTVAFRMLGR